MKILIIRHGDPNYEKDCLTDLGRREAAALGKFLSGKRFVIGSEQSRNTHLSAAAGFSLPGDAFLLVSFNAFPDKVVWIYSCKIYHYKTAEDMSPR